MKAFLNITKALGDENRLRMLLALRGGELCVCQVAELLGLAMNLSELCKRQCRN